MIRNAKALTASCFLSMFFIGVATTIIGAAARNIGLSPYQIGLFMTVQNLGFMLSVIVSGALADTHSKTNILFVGSSVLAAAFITFYLSKIFSVNLLIIFFIGIGTGSYEGVTDAMLIDIHDKRESLFINVNHFFVTFGSLMITFYLIFLQMNWRRSATQSGIVVAVLAIFFLLARHDGGKKVSERLAARIKFLVQERAVAILCVITIFAVGVELGTLGIMTTYMMKFRGFTQVTSKLVLICLLAGTASGRLLIGFFSKNKQIPALIALLLASATVLLSALFFLSLGNYAYALTYFTGMTFSALLPLVITLAGLMYKEYAGTVLGIIKFAIPIGGSLIPFVFSMLSKHISFKAGLALFPICTAAGTITVVTGWKQFRQFIRQASSDKGDSPT